MSGEGGTVIVTDTGFRPGDPGEGFVALAEVGEGSGTLRLELPADGDVNAAATHFGRTSVIRIPFRSFADGRGFTLARELRRLGYRGRIRAAGHVIPDQWPMAVACGIDEVEISAAQAERQPEAAWTARKRRPGYLDVLRG
jgi:uncharacterized protein (DUF934 family)